MRHVAFATSCPACLSYIEWTRDGDTFYGVCEWCGFQPDPIAALVGLPPVPRFDALPVEGESHHADETPPPAS